MITIRHNLPVIQHHLDELIVKLGDLSPLMADIAGILEDESMDRFSKKTAPDGTPWQDLLPASILAKMRTDGQIGGGGILVHTGTLASSIHSTHDRYSATVGTDTEYGKYHQFGTRHLPQREFLGISDDDERRILDTIESYLNA